jgi:hypothetical protein
MMETSVMLMDQAFKGPSWNAAAKKSSPLPLTRTVLLFIMPTVSTGLSLLTGFSWFR